MAQEDQVNQNQESLDQGSKITAEQVAAAAPKADSPVTFTMKDGRAASIQKGTGMNVIEATDAIKGDGADMAGEMLLPNIISSLVTVDGKAIDLEELKKLSIGDYLRIRNEVMAANGIGGADPGKLSDGRAFEIAVGNAETVIKADRMINGEKDGKMQMAAMIRELLAVEGAQMTLEDLVALPVGDYIKVQNKFAELNF